MVTCSKCNINLPADLLNSQEMKKCPGCEKLIRAFVYPAIFRNETDGNSGERILVDNEAGCFYHPKKKAVLP